MARKTIFQLVEENYDVQNEIKKLNYLFYSEKYFNEGVYFDITFEELIDKYLLRNWKHCSTCLSAKGFLKRVNAYITKDDTSVPEEKIINNLEAMENFALLYNSNSRKLADSKGIKWYSNYNTFIHIINELERHMGLSVRSYKDRVVIYPNNAPLEKVLELCQDEEVEWSLIQFVREELSLSQKKKQLAFLATQLGMEQDSKETDNHIKELMKETTNVLNNLNIRHNNKNGKENNKVKIEGLTPTKESKLCDYIFNNMLLIMILREQKKNAGVYAEFSQKQKELKERIKTDKGE